MEYLPSYFQGYGILLINFRDIEFLEKQIRTVRKSKNSRIQSHKDAPTMEENLYIQD